MENKEVQLLNYYFEEFAKRHPRFSDISYSIPVQKVEHLKQMALVNHQTVAICYPGLNKYHFLNAESNDFSSLFAEKVAFDSMLNAIHPDDLKHFIRAWDVTFSFVEDMNTDELMNYSLVYECRILDQAKVYRRVMFKYVMIPDNDDARRGFLLLFLRPIDGEKTKEPSGGIYIINICTNEIVFAEKDFEISRREIEVIHYSQKGLMSNEIASLLFISKNTVDNHRRNVLRKISVRDVGFAATYLHSMGII